MYYSSFSLQRVACYIDVATLVLLCRSHVQALERSVEAADREYEAAMARRARQAEQQAVVWQETSKAINLLRGWHSWLRRCGSPNLLHMVPCPVTLWQADKQQ